MNDELINYLTQFISPNRLNRIDQILQNRTNYFTVVLDDIIDYQNVNAVCRTVECCGIQNIHVLTPSSKIDRAKKVLKGSDQWISANYYNLLDNGRYTCIQNLRSQGYKIVATTPHASPTSIYDLSFDQPMAFVFGQERDGLSNQMLDEADVSIQIPIHGFTESYNISVAAGIVLSFCVNKLRGLPKNTWQLSPQIVDNLRLNWIKLSIKNVDEIINHYYKHLNQGHSI